MISWLDGAKESDWPLTTKQAKAIDYSISLYLKIFIWEVFN